ncbi:helix-turn-helix domain-containing protein [Bosea sp. LjRoot237]|uniref:helix-turn-helix domain-containing protein n=1 Tax=Bosea sp. LjRoot237 TaxID=3342292 RepID=UPI003ECDD3D5
MARAALNLGLRDLAEITGLAALTISRIENGGVAKTSSMEAIERALSSRGVTFLPPNKDGPGIRVTPD